MTTVAVVGSVNLDLVVHVLRLPKPGETVLGSDHVRLAGGKGGNQAVAVARLGARAVLRAAVGDDSAGKELRAALAAASVDISGLTTVTGVPTGVAFVVVAADGGNTITVAPGANRHLVLTPELVPPADVLLLQLEIPIETCLIAAGVARRQGTRVLLNASPAPPVECLAELLSLVDVLVVNETEGQSLVEGASDDAAEVAERLARLGPDVAVVTGGSKGATAAAGGTVVRQSAFPVRAVDPTGAGDAFCAALAVAIARGDNVAAAVRFGCAAGALATTGIGAQTSLPAAADVEALLATGA